MSLSLLSLRGQRLTSLSLLKFNNSSDDPPSGRADSGSEIPHIRNVMLDIDDLLESQLWDSRLLESQ